MHARVGSECPIFRQKKKNRQTAGAVSLSVIFTSIRRRMENKKRKKKTR